MGKSGGSVTRIRETVGAARDDAEAMSNLAYVVNSANDNIAALQRTIKLQEAELTEKTEHAAALQRNYETLSRIRQSDQKEFIALKSQLAEEREQLQQLGELYEAEQEKTLALEQRLQAGAAAESQMQKMRLELADATRQRDAFQAEGEKHRRQAAESAEASRSLKLSLDKTTRAKQELMSRATRAEESLKEVEAQKEALEKAQQGAPRPVCAGVATDWEHAAAPPSRAPRPS